MLMEDMPWASIVDLLEARAERIQREETRMQEETSILRPVGDNVWGIGVR